MLKCCSWNYGKINIKEEWEELECFPATISFSATPNSPHASDFISLISPMFIITHWLKLRRNLSFPLWEITRILPAGKLTRARSSQEEFCMLLLSEGSKAKHDAWTIVIFMIHTHLSSTKECSMDINVLYQGKTSHVLDNSTMVSWELDPNFHYKTLISNLIQYTSKTSMILSLNFYKMKIVMPIILYMAPSFCRGYLFSDTVKTYFWG